MKNVIISFIVGVLTIHFCYSQKCNYIEDYYQDIYKVQLSYLKGDYDKAYKILESINPNCELLNQPEIYETFIYAEICARKGQQRKAYKLLKEALKKGSSYKSIKINETLNKFLKKRYLNKLKRKSTKYNRKFANEIDSTLRKKILKILSDDQNIRYTNADRDSLGYARIKEVDKRNELLMQDIFNKYGYPNEKIIGHSTRNENLNITFLLMHFDNIEYFKPLLFEYIKNGQCKPSVLGYMIDSYDRRNRIYTYGMYRNIDSSEIKDYQNLDKRRIAIGLPPMEMRKKIIELLLKKYNIDQ